MADFSIYGRYTEANLRGNLFVYKCPGQALLLSATTGLHPTIWNPAGSGKIFVPVKLVMGFLSGTTVIGSVLLAETLAAGAAAGTGLPILTFTAVAGISARRGAGLQSTMLWSPTTNTYTTAPTVISATSINLGAADPTNSGHQHEHIFDGSIILEPSVALSITYSVTTSTALYFLSLYGLELPYPQL